jgi:SAM-dependent methyltransferase
MSIWQRISVQFEHPTGIPGSLAGAIMSKRGSNLERIDWAISILKLQPDDRVLEIGFGPGIALQKMSAVVTGGVIWGIDHSDVMVRQASRRNREALGIGRVKIIPGSIAGTTLPDIQADKVLDINSFQFWQSPVEELMKVRDVMAPGGLIALVHQPRKPGSTDTDAERAGLRFAEYLASAGFSNISVQTKKMKPVSTVCVLATK